MLGDWTTAQAREEDEIVGLISERTQLSKTEVRARLANEHGKTLVRNLFRDEWPWPTLSDEVADLTVADARVFEAEARIAQVTGLTVQSVKRRLGDVHGKTLVRNLFEDRWPDDDSGDEEEDEDDDSESDETELRLGSADDESDLGTISAEDLQSDYEYEAGATLIEEPPQHRPYQAEALGNLHSAFQTHKKVVLSLPTGAGKTFVAAKWLADNLRGRALWLTHREELVRQTEKELQAVFGRDRKVTRWTSAEKDDQGHVVIATVGCQTIPDGPFEVLVVDEAHHRVAPSYKEWAKNYRFERELGLTATPERADGAKLPYDHIVSRPFWDLVEQGYLAAPIHYVVKTQERYELRKDRIRDDFEEASLRQLDNPGRNAIVVEQYVRNRQTYGKTLIFAINVEHAENLVTAFRRAAPQVRVASILGVTDKEQRRRLVDDFEKGRVDVLINCRVFVEGFNCKDIETIFLTRPTMSAVLYCQMVGRGTRITGNKKTFHLVEFEDQLSRFADKLAGFWCLGERDHERIRVATARARVRVADPPALLPPAQLAQWTAALHLIGGVLAYWDAGAYFQGATLVYKAEVDALSSALDGGQVNREALEAAVIAGHWTPEEKQALLNALRSGFNFHLYDFRRVDVAPPAAAPLSVTSIQATVKEVAPLSRVEAFLGTAEQVDWGGDAADWRRNFLSESGRVAGIMRVVDEVSGKVMPQKVFDVEDGKVRSALTELGTARGMSGEEVYALQERLYDRYLKGTSITKYRWHRVAVATAQGRETFLDLRTGESPS